MTQGRKNQEENRNIKRWGTLVILLVVFIGSLFLKDESSLNLLRDLGFSRGTVQTLKKAREFILDGRGNYEPSKTNKYYQLDTKEPQFSDQDFQEVKDWQSFTPLDHLNRVGPANALIGPESKPKQKRGDISKVYPTGWHQKRYSFVDGEALYNRCHLIAYQLTGENANWLNLMTGTRSFNKEGMLPLENLVAAYIRDTGNQVRYRVTPVFKGDELLARGVIIEAASVKDRGKALSFRAYVPNQEPGVELDYKTGRNRKMVN